ncbi:hypothetical protein EII22_03240 [Coriobacteriales bacterium OH1046]|nr:hypothetical protein EII22_03240 [Coriobacteriales bacterium OH1046]
MNPILENIYEQPAELHRVLDDLIGPKLGQLREFSRIVDLAGEVVLTSMGSAFYSLMPMYEAMLARGMRNVSLIETAELIRHPERLSGNALYVLMSRSGESREVADFSRMLSDRQLSSMCISMTPDSTMASTCTYSLHDIASYDKIVCIKAYSSMALCGLMLASMLGRTTPDPKLVDKLKHLFDWMEAHKRDLLRGFEDIDFLASTGSFYLLSRSQGINMMRSASLWIEETAKVPANVMSLDNFYHGPMEIIRAQKITKTATTPVLLDACPDGRSRMIWRRINDAAPSSLYFGADPSAPAAFRFLLPELGLDASWMMLGQALHFQLLSYQVALCRGIEPGMFFDEGWVVT